ncbi:Aste57867_1531 [Aphanomyces stellatus]|uniref:Aste57867_1531 protein n=1 Tax=Aphanomyces stellatus TaxID=120398 RepID=A0A485K5B3_9STRA|nr:hypothetical protein As57867_001530 [Aphanomyces stellatus]VFT78746.1 Aste57867_1531 [Aphanomyces stellatus]
MVFTLRTLFRTATAVAVLTSSSMAQAEATCSVLQDIDYPGNDLSMTYQDDPSKCCTDCQATAGCKLYNWFDGVCYLKYAQGDSYPLPGGSSGILGAPPTPTTNAPTKAPTKAPVTSAPTPAPTAAPSCPRRRKSWDALTPDEKDTYISALEVAMDKGYYQKFVWVHAEHMSTTEAHGTCVFLFWHRKLLLAFETMLRSLGDRYACLTLPYWDYVQNYATMQNTAKAKRCTNVQQCCPITTGLGGTTKGAPSRSSLFGSSYPNLRCVNERPLNHMCTVPGERNCGHCIPRANWATTRMITDMSIDSVRGQIFNSGTNVAAVSAEIENSPHASVHITLSGPLNNIAVSPQDPIFFSHHNMVDLLHTIFYHCKVEPLGLSDDQKQTDPRAFEGCTTGNGDALGPHSPIMMRLDDLGTTINIEDDPLVGRFFRDLPNKYYQMADVRSLGYAFELKGLLGDLYTKCDGTTMVESVTSFDINHVVQPVVAQENLHSLGFEDAVLAQASRQGLSQDQGFKELRKMTVMLQHNCLPGDVVDFDDAAKAQWHVTGKAPSFAILENIQTNVDPIQIANWTGLLQEYYDCAGDVKEQ